MHRERATPAGVWCWPGNTSDSALIRQVKADIRDWNLSLLLIRIIETTTGDTWNDVRRELQRLHVGYFTGPADTYHQPPTTNHPHHPAAHPQRLSRVSWNLRWRSPA